MQNAIYIWERLVCSRESIFLKFWCGNLCQAVRPCLWQNWWSGLHVRPLNAQVLTLAQKEKWHFYNCTKSSFGWYVCTHRSNLSASNVVEVAQLHQGRRGAVSDQRLQRLPAQFSVSSPLLTQISGRQFLGQKDAMWRKTGLCWDPILVQALPSSIWVLGLFILKEECYHKVCLGAILSDLQLDMISQLEDMLVNWKIIWHLSGGKASFKSSFPRLKFGQFESMYFATGASVSSLYC